LIYKNGGGESRFRKEMGVKIKLQLFLIYGVAICYKMNYVIDVFNKQEIKL